MTDERTALHNLRAVCDERLQAMADLGADDEAAQYEAARTAINEVFDEVERVLEMPGEGYDKEMRTGDIARTAWNRLKGQVYEKWHSTKGDPDFGDQSPAYESIYWTMNRMAHAVRREYEKRDAEMPEGERKREPVPFGTRIGPRERTLGERMIDPIIPTPEEMRDMREKFDKAAVKYEKPPEGEQAGEGKDNFTAGLNQFVGKAMMEECAEWKRRAEKAERKLKSIRMHSTGMKRLLDGGELVQDEADAWRKVLEWLAEIEAKQE